MTPRDGSRSSLSDHCSRNGAISLSRNASSSSLKASLRATRRSPTEPDISVRFAVPSCVRMDFTFSPDQDAVARSRCAASSTAEAPKDVRAAHGRARRRRHHARGVAQDRRPRLDRLLVPEERGGLGLGVVDAVVVQEEMGRARVPRSVLLVGDPRDARGPCARARRSARRARRRARERGTVALDEAGSGESARAGARARRRSRQPLPARRREADGDGRHTRRLGARARRARARGCGRSSSSGRDAQLAPSLDITRKFARLEFDGTRGDARRSGRRPDAICGSASLDDAAVLLAAELIGVSRSGERARARLRAGARCVRQAAVEVPGDAAQGGRHAAAHRDGARSACTTRPGRPTSTRPTARSRPRWRSRTPREAANYVTAECIQIHGGVGYTWECDAHVFLRRAKVDDLLLGAPELATRTRRRPLLRRRCRPSDGARPAAVESSQSWHRCLLAR